MAVELAANNLYRMVRQFALRQPDYADAIRYMTRPDERYDLTLASFRIYKTRDEFLAVQAAAGLDSPEQVMTERQLVLPTYQALQQMKQQAGYQVTNAGR